MGILNPAALPFLSLLGVLVLIYLRQRKRTAIEVPSLLLWEAIEEERIEARRFRPDFLFWLQMLLLLLLLTGLLHPYWSNTITRVHGNRHIFVVDLSASMQAREPNARRIEIARDRAQSVLESLDPLDEVMLIGVKERPRVISGYTTDHRLFSQFLDDLEPADTTTHLELGIELALARRDRSGYDATVHVFTDMLSEKLQLSAIQRDALAYYQVGETDDNVGLASVHVHQTPFQDYRQAQTYVLVRNYASRQKTATLQVDHDNVPVFSETFDMKPYASRSFSLTGFTGPGQLDVNLASNDALSADNRAFAWVSERQPWRLVIVSPTSLLVEELRSVTNTLPGVELVQQTPDEFLGQTHQKRDIVVFHQHVPEEEIESNSVFIYPPVKNSLFPVLHEASDLNILDWNQEHQILHNLQYIEAIPFRRARILDLPSWAHILISSRTEDREVPLVLTGERDGRRVVCLAFDIEEGTLTDSDNLTLLVLFLNTLRWLRTPSTMEPHVLSVGDSFFLPPEVGESVTTVAGPYAEAAPIEAGMVTLERSGIYEIAGAMYSAVVYANLFDEGESDIGRSASNLIQTEHNIRLNTDIPSGTKVDQETQREFGQFLYWIGVFLLFAEWFYSLRNSYADQTP